MSQSKEFESVIYLGKSGQSFGPYTLEEYKKIQASPEYASFRYIWDERAESPAWVPLESPPPAPIGVRKRSNYSTHSAEILPFPSRQQNPEKAQIDSRVESSATPPAFHARASNSLSGIDFPEIEVILHNHHSIITGSLLRVTANGGQFHSEQIAKVLSKFGSQSQVSLHLYDPRSGEAMNVRARLARVHSSRGTSTSSFFTLEWSQCPELFERAIQKTVNSSERVHAG